MTETQTIRMSPGTNGSRIEKGQERQGAEVLEVLRPRKSQEPKARQEMEPGKSRGGGGEVVALK